MKAGKSVKALVLGCFLLTLGATTPAWAIPITLTFTANFSDGPEATVSGSFDYDAASVTSNAITSLNSVDLTVSGHTYTLGEIGTTVITGDGVIGTTDNGVGGTFETHNDFALYFDAGSDAGVVFIYTFTGGSGSHYSSGFSQFSITADTAVSGTAVPEPDSMLVYLTGLAGLGGLVAHRRRPVGKVSLDWANP